MDKRTDNSQLKSSCDIIVSIRCATFNQASFIRKTLDGFVMQKTNFRFEALVHDDASTDGTADIIMEYARKYPEIIKPIIETENQYSKMDNSLGRIMDEMCTGKYVANCEGDDYWTDPYKLQKQVDYLETHPDCTMVHTAFNFVDTNNNLLPTPDIPLYQNLKYRKKEGYIWHTHLLEATSILYCTTIYRNGLLDDEESYLDHDIFMSCARQGKVHYMEEVTSCYRINPTSTMHVRQNAVIKWIRQAILKQMYFFCTNSRPSDTFYKNNFITQYYLTEAFISTLVAIKDITNDAKWKMVLSIIFYNPFIVVLLPLAAISKACRLFRRKVCKD